VSGRPVVRAKKVVVKKKKIRKLTNTSAKGTVEGIIKEEVEVTKTLFGLPIDPAGWSFHTRWIPTKPPHGQEYYNISYQATPRLRVGVNWRPKTGDVSPLINYLVKSEGKEWYELAAIAGFSNNDYGEINSDALYATASKALYHKDKLTISAYGGGVHIFELAETRGVGGAIFRYDQTSIALQYSGVDTHATISQNFGKHIVSFFMFDLEKPGIAYSYKF